MSCVKYENYKLTVLHIKAKIKFEVAEEGDRLTLYVSHTAAAFVCHDLTLR